MPAHLMPKPFHPTARASVVRRSLWLLPAVLALAFVIVMARWADIRDAQERNKFQQTLLADATSVEVQLTGRKDVEQARLRQTAEHLPKSLGDVDGALASMPEVVAGMDRLWNRLVWLDADQQVVARATRLAPIAAGTSDALRIQSRGQADHFVVTVAAGEGRPAGQLLARYDMTDLLRSTDLAWLTRRYEVDFVSELGEVIATTSVLEKAPEGARYERPLQAFKDTTLRLTPYDALVSWRRNTRTLALLAGLLLLGAAASHLLRREMRRVARAVTVSQSEAAWRQSMEDSALVGLRARDLTGRILYVNKTLCDLVGYSREELVGLLPPLPFWPADEVQTIMERNQMTLTGQAPRTGTETRWQHRDGTRLEVMVFESPLVDAGGAHVGWMGSIVDISERKRLLETERLQSEALARHARLTMMGEMASSLAHDINQPLTVIANYAEGLMTRVSRQPHSDPELREPLDAIGRNAQLAGRIVQKIRDRLGRHRVGRLPCDLNAVVAGAVDLQRDAAARQGVRLVLEPAPALPLAAVDRVGIEQIVTNLVRNAIDALADSGSDRQVQVSTSLDASGAGDGMRESVRIEVRDKGPGLQGRNIETLCAWSYSTKADGLGMGLAICRHIVEDHGGTLGASDVPEGGALFYLVIPVRKPNPEEGNP
jgi:two-component system, LuxR family, sensor histidine kinase DctS